MTRNFAITWDAPASDGGASITDYEVSYTPDGGTETVAQTGSTGTSYTLTGLTTGTTYSVKVRAVNSEGSGAWSSAVSKLAALYPETPGAPTLSPGDGTLDVSWSAPSSDVAITQYKIYYTPSGGASTTVSTGSSSTTYSLTGLTNGTQYTVSVAAESSAGVGGFSANASGTPAGAPTDSDFSSVSLLLHFDGQSGAATFTDYSANMLPITPYGNAQISSAQAKFGESGLFDGSGDYLVVTDANSVTAVGTQDFTIECWFYNPVGSQTASQSGTLLQGGTGSPVLRYASGSLSFGIEGTGYPLTAAWPTDGQWHHVAVCRDSTDTRLYIDGAEVTSGTVSHSLAAITHIGAHTNGSLNWDGYIDDLRVTVGVARYQGSSYTVPSAAFPDQPPNASAPAQVSGLSATPGDTTIALAWSAPSTQTAVTQYKVSYNATGSSSPDTVVYTGSQGTAYSITGLTNGTEYYATVAAVAVAGEGAASPQVTATPAVPSGLTPNTDGSARFYLPSATTAFQVGAATTTGYYRITDGTTASAVVGASYYAATSQYWYAYYTNASLSGMSSSVGKTIELYSCDASGNKSGSLVFVNLASNSTAVEGVDLSGLSLLGASAFTSTAYGSGPYKYTMTGGSSYLPSSITEVRALGTTFGQSSVNTYSGYYYGNGLDIAGQNLDAAQLDQLYADLATVFPAGTLIVRSNPGTTNDTPSIATAKGYTVYGT